MPLLEGPYTKSDTYLSDTGTWKATCTVYGPYMVKSNIRCLLASWEASRAFKEVIRGVSSAI